MTVGGEVELLGLYYVVYVRYILRRHSGMGGEFSVGEGDYGVFRRVETGKWVGGGGGG